VVTSFAQPLASASHAMTHRMRLREVATRVIMLQTLQAQPGKGPGMKNTGILAAALLILQPLWWGSAYSAEPASPKFDVEVSKQDSIYYSKGEQRPEGYVIDRSLV